MAKHRENEQPQVPAPEAPLGLAAPQAEPDEMAALRAKVAALQAQVQELESRPAPLELSTAPAPGRYRVQLPGFRCRLASYTVEPRENAPDKLREKPQATYDGLELFGHGKHLDLGRAAWERYKTEHGVNDDVRKAFRVIPNAGGVVDALEVEALTEADAYAKFQQYNGIIASDRRPRIEKVA